MGARSDDLKTCEAIVSYAGDLFEARERESGGKGYGCTLIFKKTADLSPLHAAALGVAEEQWPGKPVKEWIKDGTIKSPFLDGDGKQGRTQDGEQRPELKGCWFIRCTSGEKFKPKVFDRNKNPVYEVADCPSGSRVFAVVNAFAWDNKSQGKGITFGVSIVQVIKKAEGDEVLGGGGGPDPDKFLEKIADEGDAPASTKGGEGAKGLFG
jgi:hypothetical protein